MSKPVFFDHIEVHVEDIPRYCEFLVQVFQGGRHKVISKSGTAMFISPEGVTIEVKKRKVDDGPLAAGFWNPCVRTENAKAFIEDELKLTVTQTASTEDGDIYFFVDHEGVTWHVKDFLAKDSTTNW